MVNKLEQKKTINIKGDSFMFDITEFTVNDFLTIEAEKQRLSGGNYAKIATSLLINSSNAANLIDMIATFRTLNPNIENSVRTRDFSKLSMLDSKELLDTYVNDFLPWYTKWLKEFNVPFREDQEGKTDEEEE